MFPHTSRKVVNVDKLSFVAQEGAQTGEDRSRKIAFLCPLCSSDPAKTLGRNLRAPTLPELLEFCPVKFSGFLCRDVTMLGTSQPVPVECGVGLTPPWMSSPCGTGKLGHSRCCSSPCQAGEELQLDCVPEAALGGKQHCPWAVPLAVAQEPRGNQSVHLHQIALPISCFCATIEAGRALQCKSCPRNPDGMEKQAPETSPNPAKKR